MKNQKSKIGKANFGFTLIELMIVITVIAILAGIVLFGLGQAQARARDTQRQQIMKALQNYLQAYASDNNGTYPAEDTFANLFAGWNSNCPVGGAGPLCTYAPDSVVPSLKDPGCGIGTPSNEDLEVRNFDTGGLCSGRIIYTYYSDVNGAYPNGSSNKCDGAAYALSLTQEGGGLSWFCAPR